MADVLARAAERPTGYVQDVLANGTQSGDFIEIDVATWHRLRGKYGPPREPSITPPSGRPLPEALLPLPASGPGSHLHDMLGNIGIYAEPGCACLARMREMDARGPDWCSSNLDTIIGWLSEEAQRRSLPFNRTAARLLVKAAIWRARRD